MQHTHWTLEEFDICDFCGEENYHRNAPCDWCQDETQSPLMPLQENE